jgi:hypothetical protein
MSGTGDRSALLERAYVDLDLVAGRLLPAATLRAEDDPDDWRSVGDWLLYAERVGAQHVFFVDDDPVLVFSVLQPGAGDRDIVDAYRRAWSLARPRCLFLAVGDELRVYALSEAPVSEQDADELTPLETVTRVADVAERLANFHRRRVESGEAFQEMGAERPHRADRQLLRDVGAASDALRAAGLERASAHRLIERAILVRYLEDRGVLTAAYFAQIASERNEWTRTLEAPTRVGNLGPTSSFARCLGDASLTEAVFRRLATDFNGDLFVATVDEERDASPNHLLLLRDLLLGATEDAGQQRLLLWAYDFSVVPTGLVSTMYELFYNRERGRSSVYYTPPQLVEFVLSDLLDERLLDSDPSICDPACGSGAFLVEAFRRLVRHRMTRLKRPLSPSELQELLLGRLRGVDLDESAVRLAAFSLYVAYLNYQSPTDILEAGPLPSLISRAGATDDQRPLTVADAFWPTADGASELNASGDSRARDATTEQNVVWRSGGYDVVVGNPPWTKPAKGDSRTADRWATEHGFAVGDRNPSQLFIWRALELLSERGVASMLISAGALLGIRGREFRSQWLSEARLEHVVNFAEVRAAYFRGAKSSFALVRFRRANGSPDGPVVYETAKRSGPEDSSPTYVHLERRLPRQGALREQDHLWKTCMAGGLRDEALLGRLEDYGCFGGLTSDKSPPRFGFQEGDPGEPSAHPPDGTLAEMRLVTDFTSWGPRALEPPGGVPEFVKWPGHPRLYAGRRLLVGLGVIAGTWVHARLEEEPFAYTHRTLGIPLEHRPLWQAQVALATLLSATGRYWLAMRSRRWGDSHDQVRKAELMRLPVRLTSPDDPTVHRIASAIEQLPTAHEPSNTAMSLFGDEPQGFDRVSLLSDIDACVNELFEMTDSERELVADFWRAREPSGRRRVIRDELVFGYADDLARGPHEGIRTYLRTFLRIWNGQLRDDGEISWQLVGDRHTRVLCAVFETRGFGSPRATPDASLQDSWEHVLAQLGAQRKQHPSSSLRRYGTVRTVTDTAIIIIKRDEQRFWSPTAAREDAEATTVQAMALHAT